MLKCKNCGKDISDYAVVCPNCGYKVNSQNTASSDTQIKKRETKPMSRKEKIILAIIILIMVIACFVFASSQNARNVLLGRDVWGLGAIFFEKQVLEGNIGSIMLPYAISLITIIVCLIGVSCVFIRHRKSSEKRG